jgi:hypothetical protein
MCKFIMILCDFRFFCYMAPGQPGAKKLSGGKFSAAQSHVALFPISSSIISTLKIGELIEHQRVPVVGEPDEFAVCRDGQTLWKPANLPLSATNCSRALCRVKLVG